MQCLVTMNRQFVMITGYTCLHFLFVFGQKILTEFNKNFHGQPL